jgi:hypothetical protein
MFWKNWCTLTIRTVTKQAGYCLQLIRALYGLRQAPKLWYENLEKTLLSFGLTKSTEDPCMFCNDWLIVFFYVDDMAIAFCPEDTDRAQKFRADLMSRYKMTDEGELRWFLGVRVLRNREQQKIWLSQQSYIEKLAHTFKIYISDRMPQIPITTAELGKNEKQATPESVHLYQQKVGSLLYAVIITRPDIARATSKLSEFLQNPSDEHHQAADQCLRYLYATRHLAIEYHGQKDCEALLIASDASFADNPDDRKSSQGYLIKLFGGPVAWKSNKQATVTTSTTEAELLALEHTVKEGFALERLFRDIQLELNTGLKFHCDNTQTIRLIVEDNARLKTRLRHESPSFERSWFQPSLHLVGALHLHSHLLDLFFWEKRETRLDINYVLSC